MAFGKDARAAKFEKRAVKKDKRAEKHADAAGDHAAATLRHLGAAANERLGFVAEKTGHVVTAGADQARSRASEAFDTYRPLIEQQLRLQGTKIAALAGDLGPKAEKLRYNVREDYIPRARKTADVTNAVLTAAVAAGVEAARREFEKGQGDIRAAATTSLAPKKNRNVAGTVALALALAAAGGAAGYVAWKKTRPVEDPWAPPADFARAHYPAAAATDSDSSQVSDTVAGAEAGDVASSLKGGATGDVSPKTVKVDSADSTPAEVRDADRDRRSTTTTTSSGDAWTTSSDSRTTSDARTTSAEAPKVIDPVGNPEENPQDPEIGEAFQEPGKKGNHRADH
ncbi:hypothetical protein JSY14_07015 [Brachybacterium sp. EF45031]|uniref:hypothetical protein n=1 Tax=Brachybacterium sillae TaxID=2810536 RepID=UPI00217F1296|nr:hypothetical protein [Brachybacterium sillae]MCS6711785.1 hypothetical protein [Brachybacterium sillae]